MGFAVTPTLLSLLLSLVAIQTYAQQRPKTPSGSYSGAVVDSIPYDSIPDSIRQKHMLHVSPHLIVFDPITRSAVIEVSNWGNVPTEGDVETQLGYTYWQNQDTALYPLRGKRERGRDTVIFNPKPEDRYAGQWLSGVPDHIALAPHEKRQFTLRLNPPADVPNGEYYARIITTVGARTKRSPVSGDTRQAYNFPIKGWDLPLIRDSVRVFYRKGPQTMGLKIVQAKAEIDTSNSASNTSIEDVGRYPLRTLVQVHLTGTSHFEGVFRMSYVAENGDEIPIVAGEGAEFTIHRDGIIRWSAETDQLPPGHRYHLIMRFIEQQEEFSRSQRLPMRPVMVELPVRTEQIGAPPTVVSTGQDLPMGVTDPYWVYLMGVSNYGSSGAYSGKSYSPIVDTAYSYNGRANYRWDCRSFKPEKNVNVGWIQIGATVYDSPLGGNTMRQVIRLPNYKGKIPPLRGRVWSMNHMIDIYVNGRRLRTFVPKPSGAPSQKEGVEFLITETDGLLRGNNALDFVWDLTPVLKAGLDGIYVIRVDFYPVFRETHDRYL